LIEYENITFSYPEGDRTVFEDLSLTLPNGSVSFIGQNGTGKSTLMLLGGGFLLPDEGTVRIDGIDTRELTDEHERQRYISLIFQNMEFETEEPIGTLLNFVYENGYHENKNDDFVPQLTAAFELEHCLGKKTQEISKGELQRTILAFSLLYGSKILLMDEPIFAMEDYQKERAMDFLVQYAKDNALSIYYSVHELDISQKYSDHILLFYYRDGRLTDIQLGPTEEIFNRDNIEEAFQIPYYMLKKREALYRERLTGYRLSD
jgi:ABC-type cobalamin/Fe3+-siderophores transport system ATPase subunit